MVVLTFLHRWLFVDLWVPVWPNIAAAILLGIHVSKSNRKTRHHVKIYLGEKEGRDADQGN